MGQGRGAGGQAKGRAEKSLAREAAAAAAAAAAEAVHRYQKGCEQSGRITYVTVKHYFST